MSSRQIGRYSGKLTGGNPGYPAGTKNGRIPLSLMRRLESQPHLSGSSRYLWPAAAVGLDLLAAEAKRDGIALRLVAAYRDYAGQVQAKKDWTARGKPENAARPGYSSHGWGTACDVDRHGSDTRGILGWLKEHGPQRGWDHPLWAGSAKGPEYGREPWHYQFVDGWRPEEESMEQVTVAVVVPNAEGSIDPAGDGWAWLRPLAEALNLHVLADEEACRLRRDDSEKVLTLTAASGLYREEKGKGYVRLDALGPLGVKAGYAKCLTLEVGE